MAGFCQIQDILNFIPQLRVDSSSDVSNGALQSLIDMRASEIRSVAKRKSYSIPSSITTPSTNKELMLFWLNVEVPAAELILRRSGEIDPMVRRIANVHLETAMDLWNDFRGNQLDGSFLFTLPTTAFCTVNEVAAYSPSFTPSVGSFPSDTAITRWINCFSAVIYNYIKLQGYKSDYSTMTTDQKLLYKRLVAERVASYIVRIRGEQYIGALNEQANMLLDRSMKEFRLFRNNRFDDILK